MSRTATLAAGILVCVAVAVPTESAEPSRAPELVVTGPVPVTAEQLDQLLGNKLLRFRSEEYTVKRKALEGYLADRLLDRQAAARGLSLDELLRQEVDAKASEVREEDVRAAYQSTRGVAGESEDLALSRIRAGMKTQRIALRRAEFIKELRARSGVRILLEPPRLSVSAGNGPSKGPAAAAVTIVEFSDFQCPFCGRMAPTLRRIEGKYQDQVRIVFRDFPLPMHSDAPKAAEAGRCAAEQGRFWPMYDKLFANQTSLRVPDLKRYAVEVGVEARAFDACLDGGKYDGAWRADLKEGEGYGIAGTPTFFINGRPLLGVPPFEVFEEIIDEELAIAAAATGPKAAVAQR